MKIVAWTLAATPQLRDALAGLPDIELVAVSNLAELAAARRGAEVYLTGNMAFSPAIAAELRQWPALRFLHFTSAGYDGLDHGISEALTICNAGGAWSASVAEHAMALLLALARQVPGAVLDQQARRWNKGLVAGVRSLDGQTLAVLGLGSIGKAVARRARPFNIRVIGISRSATPDDCADEVHPSSALHGVLARADAVVVATPLTPETRNLLDDAAFAALKPGALVVNVSRGATVDAAALLRAIDRGIVAGAALDVTEPEPLPADSPLWARKEILITPHIASVGSAQARIRLSELIRDNIAAFRSGAPLSNCLRDRRRV